LLAILKLKSLPNKFSIRQIEKICEEKNDLYVKKINFIDEKNIYPRIQNFIQSLNKHNVKLALASSSQNAKTILKQLNLISFFDYLVDPITIKNPKPAPDIYIAATKGLHLSPNECIGIEDAIVGIEGLQAANIFTVGIDYGVKPVQLKSDISFATPSDISLDKIIKAYEKQKK
jgi:beta-phosphoglucomutase